MGKVIEMFGVLIIIVAHIVAYGTLFLFYDKLGDIVIFYWGCTLISGFFFGSLLMGFGELVLDVREIKKNLLYGELPKSEYEKYEVYDKNENEQEYYEE